MNWLIWEKIYTYFYNKIRPVNRMHYIKCGVNSSLHNSGCCIRSVAPLITVLSWRTVFTKRVIYYKFTFVWHSMKQGNMHRPTSHLAHCVPFLWPREEHKRQPPPMGWWFRWPVFVVATSVEACYCCCCCSSSSSTESSTSLASTPDPPSRSQQPEFHCWVPPQVVFIFFQPLLDTHNHLPFLDYYVWLGTVAET